MAQVNYVLRPQTHAESVQWLRRKLGRPTPPPKPRPPCRLHLLAAVERDEIVSGLQVLALFTDRDRCPRAGKIAAVRRRGVSLWWWGLPARSEFVLFEEIQALRVIAGDLSWETWHSISAAQRRGECPPEIRGRDRRHHP